MSAYRKVSIVIPIYNERSTIDRLLAQVKAAPTLDLEKEIILVDDCSSDGTTDYLKKLSDSSLKIFFHERNQGKGAALRTAFHNVSGDIVIIQDADLEYDPMEIEKVLKPFFDQGAKVVYGSRYLRPDPNLNFWHSFFNKAFTRVGNLFTGLRLTDLMTCYKAFTAEVLKIFLDKLESERFGFEPEVSARIARAGYQIVEVPISYDPRGHDEGKHMTFRGEIECLWVLIKYSLLKK